MVHFPKFAIFKIPQLGSSHAFYSPKLRSIPRTRVHTLPLSRMQRSKAEHETELCGSGAARLQTEAVKGLQDWDEELRTSHQQRTATDPRQNAIHDVILSKVETIYQNVRLLRLRPAQSRVDHEADEGHSSGEIHASRLNPFRRRFSQ